MLLLTMIDQGASSVSNFALALIVAHYSGAREIGIFAIATSTYVLVQGLTRSMSSDCLLTRVETDDALMECFERGGYLAALLISVVMAIMILAVSAVLSGGFALPLVLLALAFPFLAAQDFARYVGISRHNPGYAIWLDASWLVLFLAGYAILRALGKVDMPWMFGAWTVSGAAVGILTLRPYLFLRAGTLLRFWTSSESHVGIRFACWFLVSQVSNYLTFYLLLLFAVVSVSDAGTLKLSLLAVGPVTVMIIGLQSALITVAAKRFPRSIDSALRFLALAAVGLAVVSVVWGAGMYLAPTHVIGSVLGRAWPGARSLLPYWAVTYAFSAAVAAGSAGLRALRAASQNLRTALWMLPLALGLPMGGAALWGDRGFAAGSVVATAVYATVVWSVLFHTSRRAEISTLQAGSGGGEGAALLDASGSLEGHVDVAVGEPTPTAD